MRLMAQCGDELMVYGAPPPSLSAYTSTLASTPPSAVFPSHASPRPVSFRLDSPPQQRPKRTAPRRSTKVLPSANATTPRAPSPSRCTISPAARARCYFRAQYVWWWSTAAAATTTTGRLRLPPSSWRLALAMVFDPARRGELVVGRHRLGLMKRNARGLSTCAKAKAGASASARLNKRGR
ncbi:hypothetical protein C8R45DRAFT_147929 [Mycena sanguinolenta]|nr:hypothetical protein C8R45DRAFT_147929 [Mycena sanguinolenta]